MEEFPNVEGHSFYGSVVVGGIVLSVDRHVSYHNRPKIVYPVFFPTIDLGWKDDHGVRGVVRNRYPRKYRLGTLVSGQGRRYGRFG